MHHRMDDAFIEPLLTWGLCTDDRKKIVITLVRAEHTIQILKPN